MPIKTKPAAKTSSRAPSGQITPLSKKHATKQRKAPPPVAKRPLPTTTHAAAPGPAAASPNDSKQSRLIAMLESADGATLAQMTSATGWQPHTVRGTISGVMRKKLGLNVICSLPDTSSHRVYRIVPRVAS